ncbi:MAG: hypothetical protein ACLVIY_14545 [Anaerobutyricum soehngenii]
MWSKKLAVFFFVGYFLAAYLEVPIMGVCYGRNIILYNRFFS